MPNRIEIEFNLDKPGAGRAALRAYASAMTELKSQAEAAGQSIDTYLSGSIGRLSPTTIRRIASELKTVENNARQAAQEVDRLNQAGFSSRPSATRLALPGEVRPVNEMERLGQAGFRRIGEGEAPAALADRITAAKFDAAAKALNETERAGGGVARMFGEAERAATGFTGGSARGLFAVRNALLRLADVPQARAVGAILQLGGGGVFAIAAAGVAAFVGVTAAASIKLREQAEENLQRIQGAANLGLVGGGLEQRTGTAEKFAKLLQQSREESAIFGEIPAAQRPSRSQGLERYLFGIQKEQFPGFREALEKTFPEYKTPEPGFVDYLRNTLGRAEPAIAATGVGIPLAGQLEVLRRLLPGTPEEAGPKNEAEAKHHVLEIDRQILEVEMKLGTVRNSLVDLTRKEYESMSQLSGRLRSSDRYVFENFGTDVERLRRRTQERVQAGSRPGATDEEIQAGKDAFQNYGKELGLIHEAYQQHIRDIQEGESNERQALEDAKARSGFINSTFGSIREQLKGMTSQLSADNPFVKIYEDAQQRAEQFQKYTEVLPRRLIDQFREANQQIRDLELFKVGLESKFQISELIARRTELERGTGLEAGGQKRARGFLTAIDLEAEARAIQQGGIDLGEDARRRINAIAGEAGIGPRGLAESIKAITDKLNPEQLSGAGLEQMRRQALLDLASFERRDVTRKPVAVEQAERDIQAVQGLRPGTPQFAFANQSLLAALSKVGPEQKTPELAEAEMRAINAQISIEQGRQQEAKEQLDKTNSLLADIKDILNRTTPEGSKQVQGLIERMAQELSSALKAIPLDITVKNDSDADVDVDRLGAASPHPGSMSETGDLSYNEGYSQAGVPYQNSILP